VQEGDGLNDANEAMLRARRYVCDIEGSRAAEVEAEPGRAVPSERAEIHDAVTSVRFKERICRWRRAGAGTGGSWRFVGSTRNEY
jgi:hypothetical protein